MVNQELGETHHIWTTNIQYKEDNSLCLGDFCMNCVSKDTLKCA